MTFAILSRVNVSSRKRRLISFKTSSCVGFDSSRTFLSAKYDAPRRLQKCCAKIQPESAATSTKPIPNGDEAHTHMRRQRPELHETGPQKRRTGCLGDSREAKLLS